jgi:cell division transport system permease protein
LAANSEEKFQKRRLLSSYASVVLSITLVLFLVGVLGLLLLNSKKVADHFKEQIALTIFLKDNARDIDVTQLQKSLQLEAATRQVNFVSKEEAAAQHAAEIGEDFMEFLGYNPLLASIDVYFNAQYVTPSFIEKLSTDYAKFDFVDEVYYDQPLLELLSANIEKISYWLLAASIIFILVALLLINSSIRLSIYSKRLVIKTMQLVGATEGFIRRPFMLSYIRLGFLGAFLASVFLGGVLWELNQRFPELELLYQPLEPAMVFGGVIVLGVGISWISSFLATQRYLNLKTDAVY